MDRRHFLRTAAIVAAGAIAADQLELLERLAPRRLMFPGWTPTLWGCGTRDDTAAIQAIIDGREVWDARQQRFYTGYGCVPRGDYLVTSTIEVANGQEIHMSDSRLKDAGTAGPLIRVAPAARYQLHSNIFISNSK